MLALAGFAFAVLILFYTMGPRELESDFEAVLASNDPTQGLAAAQNLRSVPDGAPHAFTAAELVWLTTPLSIRKAQYRPDIVIRAKEAMLSENLWAPDYKPNNVEREASRRLQRIVAGLEDGAEPEEIEGIDSGLTTGDEDELPPVETAEGEEEDGEGAEPVVMRSPLQEPVSAGVMAGGGY